METAFWILAVLAVVSAVVMVAAMVADYFSTVIGSALVFFISVIGVAVIAAIAEGEQWQKFSAAHACVKVGEMSGSTFNTVGTSANGQLVVGVGSTPAKVGWKCDDGVTYWR